MIPREDLVPVLFEGSTREQLGEAATRLLDIWSAKSSDMLGVPLEVVTVDRRHTEWANVPGEFNTVEPRILPERGRVLLVMMDHIDAGTFDEVVWTHEVGHWVLFLDGFLFMRSFDRFSLDVEIALNSVTHHRAVYALQRSCGLDPQPIIDAGAAHDRDRLATMAPGTRSDQLIALVAADDILSTSSSIATEIRGIVEERYPKAGRILQRTLELCAQYDLQSADGVQKLTRQIVDEGLVPGRWIDWDNCAKLVEEIGRDREPMKADR